MDSVEKLNKLFNIDEEPSPPMLLSRKYEDIITCLEESALEIDYFKDQKLHRTDGSDLDLSMQDQEAWLRDVTNCNYDDYGIPEPINWSDNRDIAFAKLNLAAAGQQLNVRKLEEDGIDDWVGQNFPAFKNNPNYHPYPKTYKMNNQQEITSKDIEALADQIKSGSYPKSKVKLDPYFYVTHDGEIVPVRELRIQVRDKDRDIDRINRAVNKMQKTGDKSGLEPLTMVRFPDDVIKINNGNHSAEMGYRIGEKEADAFIVDFNTDLGGKLSNALTLGNLLNKLEVEKVDVHDTDVRKELYQMMDERAEEGLDPKPPEEELVALCNRYPHISRGTIGQWISNREDVGGRRAPLRTYTAGELQSQKLSLENMQKYRDYTVLDPRTLEGALETGVEQAFRVMKDEKKRKCLVILYCSTRAQQDKWEQKDIESKIKKEYFELGQYWNCTIEYEMLCYE